MKIVLIYNTIFLFCRIYLTFVRRSEVWNMGTNSSQERAPRVGDNRQQPDIERSFSQDPQKIQDLTRLIAAETNHQHEVATDTYDYRQVS